MTKLLVLAVLLAAAWMVFRRKAGGQGGASGAAAPTPGPQTLERCPICGVYLLPGAGKACERPECPHRRKS